MLSYIQFFNCLFTLKGQQNKCQACFENLKCLLTLNGKQKYVRLAFKIKCKKMCLLIKKKSKTLLAYIKR